MRERRSSPYLAFMSFNSSLIICMRRSSFARISFKSVIVAINSSNSARNLSCSRPVNWRKRISTIARVWISDKPKRSDNLSLALSGLADDLIISITSSMLSDAMIKPSKICARSSAFLKSKRVLLITTSWRKATNSLIISRKFNKRGRPSTKQILFTEKEVWSAVNL